MRIIAVDDELPCLESIESAVHEVVSDAEIHTFSASTRALEFAGENKIDVAFIDISIPVIDGLMLAEKLKRLYGRINIIFVTGFSSYAKEAFDLHASGYICKPVCVEDIRNELLNLRYNPLEDITLNQRVRVKCFGSLNVYVDGKLLSFSRSKPKELFAYLVHKNGAAISSADVAAILWEDKEYNRSLRSQVQTVVSQMTTLLKEFGVEDIIIKGWNSISIDKDKIDCDYFDFLAGKENAVKAYTGEYLVDYSWAEFTNGYINRKIENK